MQIDVSVQPVAELAPYARNARKHNEAAISRLVAIIEEMGWTNPILVDEDGIVAGHKRRLAALAIYANGGVIRLPNGRELPAGMVPVLDVSGWTEAQRRAYIIADNQTTLESEWDGDVLRLELSWLDGSGDVDMGLTGFDGEALALALSTAPELNDGVQRESNTNPKASNASLLFGSYRAMIDRDAFLRWEDRARSDGDFTEQQMLERLVKMMGLDPATDLVK